MPDYDFRSLSPSDFERLACDVLNKDLGLQLYTFPEGRDGGIDLQEVTKTGHTTIAQCKHYAKSSASAFLRAVEKETTKPALKRADRYIFITSQPLPPARETKVANILGISRFDVWGPGKINRVLGEHSEIERQHFKLWLPSTTVLSEIINAGLWARTEARLRELTKRAQYWVDVPAYRHVRDIIANEGLCVVAGTAGVGKTFLAERLTLQALRDGWRVIYISNDLDAAWAASRTDEKHFFVYDDFLGQAELRHNAADNASDLLNFLTHVRNNKDSNRLIATTREQVLTQAKRANSDRLRDVAVHPACYTIAMPALEAPHRAEILVNHLYFSDLLAAEREKLTVDTRMSTLVSHPSYNPRVIEAITGQPLADSTADAVLGQLVGALANPVKIWEVTFKALSDLAKEVVLTLATFPPGPIPYQDLREAVAPQEPVLSWQEAVKSLEPTWIKLTGSGRDRFVAFSNPGCRDYILGRLDDDDLAEDRVYNRMGRFEQLVSLSQSAGLLAIDSGFEPIINRRKLATALLSRQAELSVLIGEWWESWVARSERAIGQRLLRLRDAAALSAIYGTAYTSTWLMQRATGIVDGRDAIKPPCVEGLALARQLIQVPAQVETARNDLVHRLIAAALGSARTLRDLDAYESLPDGLRTEELQEIARQRAALVIDVELNSLLDDSIDPRALEESAHELRERSRWYGSEIDIDPVLDHIDDLARGEPAGNTRRTIP